MGGGGICNVMLLCNAWCKGRESDGGEKRKDDFFFGPIEWEFVCI